MVTLEINPGTSTTFEIERGTNRMDDLFQTDISPVGVSNKLFKSHRRNFINKNTGLYSTFILCEDYTASPSILSEAPSLDYDVTTPLKVNKRFTAKVRIKSITRHQPRIFFDE